MTVSGTHGLASQINVTPLIDVLLVLLIIFLVVAPVTPMGLGALVPQPAPAGAEEFPRNDIVISVHRGGAVDLNRERVERADLGPRLARIFELRGNTVIFVRGDRDLEFGDVARVIDLARGAGLTRIALLTSDLP